MLEGKTLVCRDHWEIVWAGLGFASSAAYSLRINQVEMVLQLSNKKFSKLRF